MDAAVARSHGVAGAGSVDHEAVEVAAGVVAAVDEGGLVVGLVFSNLFKLLDVKKQ